MDPLQRALKALYYSLGGNANNVRDTDDVNAIIDAIGALNIGAQISGGGSELPTVTSDDNGDVLTVVEGAWGKAAPSGGGSGVMVVTISTNDENVGVANKTAGEIWAAMSEGLVVFEYTIEQTYGSNTIIELCSSAQYVDGEGYYFYYWSAVDGLRAATANDYPSTGDMS